MSDRQYRYDLVEKPSRNVICPICLGVTVAPFASTCCGRHFCRECTQDLDFRSECPSCLAMKFEFFHSSYFQQGVGSTANILPQKERRMPLEWMPKQS